MNRFLIKLILICCYKIYYDTRCSWAISTWLSYWNSWLLRWNSLVICLLPTLIRLAIRIHIYVLPWVLSIQDLHNVSLRIASTWVNEWLLLLIVTVFVSKNFLNWYALLSIWRSLSLIISLVRSDRWHDYWLCWLPTSLQFTCCVIYYRVLIPRRKHLTMLFFCSFTDICRWGNRVCV